MHMLKDSTCAPVIQTSNPCAKYALDTWSFTQVFFLFLFYFKDLLLMVNLILYAPYGEALLVKQYNCVIA